MKFLFQIALAVILISTNAFAQKRGKKEPVTMDTIMPMRNGLVVYTNVIKVDGVTKDQLYNRAKIFFVKNYKSANDVIQLDDKETGQIVGKGIIKVIHNTELIGGPFEAKFSHTLSVTVKDGRYKYEFTNLVELGSFTTMGKTPDRPIEDIVFSKRNYYQTLVIDAHGEFSQFIQSLIDEMNKKSDNEKDDW
jgi:hypothetical protein